MILTVKGRTPASLPQAWGRESSRKLGTELYLEPGRGDTGGSRLCTPVDLLQTPVLPALFTCAELWISDPPSMCLLGPSFLDRDNPGRAPVRIKWRMKGNHPSSVWSTASAQTVVVSAENRAGAGLGEISRSLPLGSPSSA